jgi:ADP-heptose:LPS heptosyltransferase
LADFDLVYDLQTSSRSSRYFILAGRPRWCGIARGCALPHDNPDRDALHTRERQEDQLRRAGITEFPPLDLSWLPETRADLPRRYALVVPGAAVRRPAKRWPADHYGVLCRLLWDRGMAPVVIGGPDEQEIAALIELICPQTTNLVGQTSLGEIFAIARRAAVVVGNDTGPMHLAALSGAPCVVLFGADSNADITAPRGPEGEWATVLRTSHLAALPAETVFETVKTQARPSWA